MLIDITMDGTDGLTAARYIRELDVKAQIVMLTQHNERAYRDEAMAIGVKAYILKEHLGSILSILKHPTESR